MHLAAYVKQLRDVVIFLVTANALTMEQLAAIWRSQEGSHTAVVSNVHSILMDAARDLSYTMTGHLLECFGDSWKLATKAQDPRHMEQLLDFVLRLSKEDASSKTAADVMELLWETSSSPTTPRNVMEVTLKSHLKLLVFRSTTDTQRITWLERCGGTGVGLASSLLFCARATVRGRMGTFPILVFGVRGSHCVAVPTGVWGTFKGARRSIRR